MTWWQTVRRLPRHPWLLAQVRVSHPLFLSYSRMAFVETLLLSHRGLLMLLEPLPPFFVVVVVVGFRLLPLSLLALDLTPALFL